jgi:hypothetical protein
MVLKEILPNYNSFDLVQAIIYLLFNLYSPQKNTISFDHSDGLPQKYLATSVKVFVVVRIESVSTHSVFE